MLSDLRFAFRLLLKQPTTTLAAVLALAFGLGLSTTIFNAYSAVIVRPIPGITDESSLVAVRSQQVKQPDSLFELSMPDLIDLRTESKTLTGFITHTGRTMIFGDPAKPERVLGADISAETFEMFGTRPHLGRLFNSADAAPDAPAVALISHGLWQRRYAGREDVLNRVEILNGLPTTIIGVLPPGFDFPSNQEMWTVLRAKYEPKERASHNHDVYARLRPGVTIDEARAEVAALGARFAAAYPASNEGKSFQLVPFREQINGDATLLMRLTLGAAIAVLLIACANVANLLLARTASRANEIAIRVSVGATRGRIVRQVLTESLLLASFGGGLGYLASVWMNTLFVAAIPTRELPPWMTFSPDWRVFAFAATAAILSALVFGLFPALAISRTTALELKEGARASTGSRRSQRIRQLLVIAQVALSALLLIVAGLFFRSFLNARAAAPGYVAEGVITFRVGLPPSQYTDVAEVRRFFDALTPALNRVPGVVAAGATSILPTKGNNSNVFGFEGDPAPKTIAGAPLTTSIVVSRRYLEAMRVPLLRGRTFAETDGRDSPRVCLVDRQFVARWSPDRDPIGRRVRFGLDDEPGKPPTWATIIGVVENAPLNLSFPYVNGAIYSLLEQEDLYFASYAVQTRGDPASFGPALQRAVSEVKPGIPIYDLITQRQLAEEHQWHRGFFSQIFGIFGLGALFLAALGVYSVMTYSVTQRTPEIGVRMALGASPGEVVRLVGRQGFVLVAVGLVTGIISALVVSQLLASLLYGVSPSDPPTYFTLTLVLAAVGLFACWLPARRATRIDPLTAIRAE